ncbi:GAF domain-containing protein [Rhodohalobacter sp.]|uniref:GAF domain-containing protein n=1 Tax=Rhodohalobacter sp. TaxID=1974210 RepID=UPI002ACE0F6C|nr:GAF domain-containing protein [Rhodohalobacter sp.]MDZ7758018.1 GAF domain-containing protein [Rhodohalobacter sp.]
MDNKREEKALFEFKHAVEDIMQLLRKSTEADTVYMYWVNRTRQQFVLETSSTILPNVMFKDRIAFDEYYLDNFKEIENVIQLKVEEDFSVTDLSHYHDHVPVRFITLIPFINNGETVALTVVETEFQINLTDYEDVISAYRNALLNLLNTYLELTDLYENEKEWAKYDESLETITPKLHKAEVLEVMAAEIQKYLRSGGVSVVARGMDSWCSVLRSSKSPDYPKLGLLMEEKSVAYDALQKGRDVFAIHFNQNPKRISGAETNTDGATYAIPIMIHDRRHAVVIVYDNNPLTFKDSVKHKLKNLVRIASLAIQISQGKVDVDKDILTSEYGNFIPEVWERTLSTQIKRAGKSEEKTWFGFVTINNLQELRSRFRLEDLKRLQRSVVNILNPGRNGYSGLIGFNSDYIYAAIITGNDDRACEKWMSAVDSKLEEPVQILGGQKIKLSLTYGMIEVEPNSGDQFEQIRLAKRKLSDAMNGNQARSASNF